MGAPYHAVPRGEAHYRARLTEADVLTIRASSDSDSALAKRYRVNKGTVIWARSGRSWAHLSGAHARRPSPVASPGKGHHRAKLTEAAVLALRAGTLTEKAIRETFSVGPLAVWKARKGITWKHLPLAPQS